MKELIKITSKDGQQLVSARELHEFLEIGRKFTTWIKDKIEKYEFVENTDFTVINFASQNGEANKCSRGGQNKVDYIITIDMAKEISMVENNDKGKEARRYFIECERIAHNPNAKIENIDRAKSHMQLLDITSNVLRMNDSSKITYC